MKAEYSLTCQCTLEGHVHPIYSRPCLEEPTIPNSITSCIFSSNAVQLATGAQWGNKKEFGSPNTLAFVDPLMTGVADYPFQRFKEPRRTPSTLRKEFHKFSRSRSWAEDHSGFVSNPRRIKPNNPQYTYYDMIDVRKRNIGSQLNSFEETVSPKMDGSPAPAIHSCGAKGLTKSTESGDH